MKEVRVITVNGLHGAGAQDIGALLAQQFGWNLLDKKLVEQIAEKAQVDPQVLQRFDEHVDSWYSRLLKGLWRSGFESGAAHEATTVLDCESTLDLTKRAVHEAAKMGNCVIVGRGGQVTLAGRDDVYHVFIYAPLDQRIRRVARQVKDEALAEKQVHRVDHERETYIKRFFGEDWCEPALYDMMLNATMSDLAAANTIACAVRGKSGK